MKYHTDDMLNQDSHDRISRHTVMVDASLREAFGRLNDLSGGIMTLFVLDNDGKVCGSLTDGDIRRAIVGGASLESHVSEVMHRQYHAVSGEVPDVAALRNLRARGISMVPHIDCDRRIIDIIDLSGGRTLLPLHAVLMAGGKGERLRPLTLDTPKPLLKIGGKAIIDYNVEALARCGISNINVTVRYLADKIRDHFRNPVAGVHVNCIEEDSPLGTIGATGLVPLPLVGNTIVMNSDLLTNISYEDMYLHHLASNADITMAVIPYQVSVPYAIVDTADDGNTVKGLAEKPVYSHFANAGIYIMPNRLLRGLPSGTPTDAPDLIERAIADGLKVCIFPINGTWIDIGSPTDFKQAAELMKYHRGYIR